MVSASYAMAKRLVSRNTEPNLVSKNKIKSAMFTFSSLRKIKEDIFFNSFKKSPHKHKLLIVNFNDFFNKKSDTMHNICNFLDIKFEESMMQPHMLDSKINNVAFHKNVMNDDPNELFSEKEINKIIDIQKSKNKLVFYSYLYRILIKVNLLS